MTLKQIRYYIVILLSIATLAFLGLSITIKTTDLNEKMTPLQKKLTLLNKQNNELEKQLITKKSLARLDKIAHTLGLDSIKHKRYVQPSATP